MKRWSSTSNNVIAELSNIYRSQQNYAESEIRKAYLKLIMIFICFVKYADNKYISQAIPAADPQHVYWHRYRLIYR